jgi:hypothetical protein
VVLSGFPAAATSEVEDVDGAPLGELSEFSAAATTEVEDVDGGPPRGDVGISGSDHNRS